MKTWRRKLISFPYISMTFIANQNSIFEDSIWRFKLEAMRNENLFLIYIVESCILDCEKHENILFKAAYQIHCSQWMLAVQPIHSGKCNTAKSCTDYRINIWNIPSKALIITMRHFIHYYWKLYNKWYLPFNLHSFVCTCHYFKL